MFTPDNFKGVQEAVNNDIKSFSVTAKYPREVLGLFMSKEGYRIDEKGVIIRTRPSRRGNRSQQSTIKALKAHYKEWCCEHDVSSHLCTDEKIDTALTRIAELDYDTKLDLIEQTIDPYSPRPDEWIKFQRLTGFNDNDILILRSWIWNVKQVIFNVPDRMEQIPMPVLFSTEQGTGKSTVTRALCSPVASLSALCKLNQISDNFFTPQWGRLLVADFDEMAGHDKTDINKFKTWYTSEHYTYRGMHSESTYTVERTVSAIGSSNKPVKDVLWDETGSRRVWQIQCYPGLYKVAGQIDWIALWGDVDCDAKCPLMEGDNFERILTVQQDEQRRKPSTELFMQGYLEEVVSEDYRFSTTELYTRYKDWCFENGEQAVKKSTFKDQITNATKVSEQKSLRTKAFGVNLGYDLKAYVMNKFAHKFNNTNDVERMVGTSEINSNIANIKF